MQNQYRYKQHPKQIQSNATSLSVLSRRTVLRGHGVSIALPLLDAMTPTLRTAEAPARTQRLIAIQTNQGILPKYFFAKGEGRAYEASPYLRIQDKFRDSMTVFSGVSQPEVDGGQSAEKCFFTAAPHPGMGGFATPSRSIGTPLNESPT